MCPRGVVSLCCRVGKRGGDQAHGTPRFWRRLPHPFFAPRRTKPPSLPPAHENRGTRRDGVSAAWSRARRRRPCSSRDPRVHERAKGGRAEVCFRREAQSWESALGHWPEHPQFRQPGKRAPRGQSDCPPAASDAPSLRLLFPPASSSASAGATRTPAAPASASSTFRS